MSRRFARNSALGTVASVFVTFGNFVGGLILARFLGVEGTGTVAFAAWVVSLTVAIGGLGIPPTLSVYLPELIGRGEKDAAADLSAYLCRIALVVCLFTMGVYGAYAFRLTLAPASDASDILASPYIWILIGLWSVTQMMSELFVWYLNGMQRFAQVALFAATTAVTQLACLLLGIHFFGVYGALGGYICGMLVTAIGALSTYRPGGKIESGLRTRVFKFSLFRWASTIAGAVAWSRMEVFFLQTSWGNEAVGYFTVALALSALASQGPPLLTRGFTPFFAEKMGEGAIERAHGHFVTGTRVLCFLFFPACLGLAAVTPSLLPLIYGDRFAPSVPAAMVLIAASAGAAISATSGALIGAMKRSDFEFYSGMVGAVISVALGLTVIPYFGLIGAAYARAIVQVLTVLAGIWFVQNRLRTPFPVRELLKLLAAAVLCALAARFVGSVMPGLPGLLLSILAGAIVYTIAVRIFGALPAEDVETLLKLLSHLPGPLATLSVQFTRLIAPPPPRPKSG